MWLPELLIAAASLGGPAAAVASARRSRHPLMLQWGRFTNQRPGLKGDRERISRAKQEGLLPADAGFDGWADEPDVVEYDDFKYWLRVRPNPGLNLPILGYWSRGRGRKRLIRPWEGK